MFIFILTYFSLHLRVLINKNFMKTTKEIQDKLSEKFKNLVLIEDYKGANEKITIKCTNCGYEWKAIPRSVINSKCGCPKCGVKSSRTSQAREAFLSKLDTTKYDFIEYKNYQDVTVRCKECGNIRHTTADNILRFGCKSCASTRQNEYRKLTTEEFITRSREIHGTRYDYSRAKYIAWNTPVCIICSKHGEFWQKAGKHLSGHNCPKCRESAGEELVRLALEESKIPFEQEKHFQLYKKVLVDFYINLNGKEYIIEVNGEQHYMPVEYFGGQLHYNEQVKRDQALFDYCKENNIRLFIIKYNENKLERIQAIINEILPSE